jgi:hypothetical protein
MGKIEYSTKSTTQNTTAHNNQHEPPPPYPSAALALSLHGQAIGTTNRWCRSSLWSHSRGTWLGLAARWLVCLFGGQNETTSKNREEHGASVLDGRHLIGRHNNQIGVSNRSSRDVGEEAPPGWRVWGDVSASIWAVIRTTTKKQNIIHLGLRRPPMDYFHTTTNQKEREWHRKV